MIEVANLRKIKLLCGWSVQRKDIGFEMRVSAEKLVTRGVCLRVTFYGLKHRR